MSLSGMMRTGASGMNAQASRLGTVADNIANSNTTGYKKASTQFSSLILPAGGGAYNSGGVIPQTRYSISEAGTYTNTTSVTDLAIKGEGFFIVQGTDGVEYLTRAGAFTVQADGTLLNSAGFTLMGYPYSSTADPTIVINGFAGLEPVVLSADTLTAQASASGELGGNLPGNEPVGFSKPTSLVAYDSPEPMKVFFVVTGPLIWLDDDGNGVGHYDVHDYIAAAREHYEKVGIGADYVKTLFR